MINPMENYEHDLIFLTLSRKLASRGWSSDKDGIVDDPDWGWILLADRTSKNFGILLRRIKPYEIKSDQDLQKAKQLQSKLKRELVEIHPYKIVHDANRNKTVQFLQPLWVLGQ